MAAPAPALADPTTAPDNAPLYGVYDPAGSFADRKDVGIEHVYVPLLDGDLDSLALADRYAVAHHRELLISVEPRSWAPEWTIDPAMLHDRLVGGAYDPVIRQICARVGAMRSSVTIRFAHAMDMSNGRYPWQNWAPTDYVAAYRHFVDTCRRAASKAQFMWSPGGSANMDSYYPGDTYADEVGLSVFDLEQADFDSTGKSGRLASDLRPAYDRAKIYDKPVVLAEIGFHGSRTFDAAWRHDVKEVGKQFPLLRAIVYFNDIDPFDWPKPYGHPDWRVSADLFE